MKIDPDDLLTVGEAAKLRNVTHQAISHLVRMRRIRTVNIRGRAYILLRDIETYSPLKPGPRPKENTKSRNKKTAKRRK